VRPPRSSAVPALAERLAEIVGGDDASVATFEATIACGPDPLGAALRAETLRDDALAALASEHAAPLRRLLHQGSYPARLLNAWPPAIGALCGRTPRLRDAAPAAIEGPPTRAELVDEFETAIAKGRAADVIAQVRTREYLRIAALEIADAPLEVVGGALSDLAAACTHAALLAVDPGLAEDLVVFGMGKLGGGELNFLSDIDLLFAHRDELIPAGADGFRPRARLFDALRKVVKLLEGEGVWRPLFRVDLRLRPFGTRGPLSLSETALLDYYERHGRAWERQMWLRAHPIAGNEELGQRILDRLDPFVYRRTLSPAVFAEIEDMMSRARRETARGLHDDGGDDLKYGPGGIRDVEFFVQGLQLLNGGKNPAVRATDTLGGLDRLLAQGLLADREHAALTAAYRWLRRVEHRVQLVEGQQTHTVPGPLEARRALAARLAAPNTAVSEAEADALLGTFDAVLSEHLGRVRNIVATMSRSDGTDAEASGFLDVVDAPQRAAAKVVLDPTSPRPALESAFSTLGLFDPAEAAGMLQSLRGDARSAFSATDDALRGANRLLMACLDAPDPDSALRRLSEFSSRRPAHYAAWRFLAAPENDAIVRLVAELFASSEALCRGLVGFPGPHGRAGDEALSMLVDARQSRLPDPASLSAIITAFSVSGVHGDDLDRALLIHKHRELTRIALHDLAKRPGPAKIGAAISAVATATLRALAEDLAREYATTARDQPQPPSFRLCVVGLGKFGMESMDYGSDLDVVFVFDPIDTPAVAVQSDAVRVTRSLQRRLEDRRLGARLFEVDTRLRPSGRQGLLVSSLESFRRYHDGSLPTWERLAALRMRPVVEVGFGPAAHSDRPMRSIGDEIEREIRTRSVWPDEDGAYEGIAADVRALKSRIEAELSRETRRSTRPAGRDARYNAKSGVGGALELELLVSTLQLRAGRTEPSNDGLRGRDIWRALDALHDGGWLDGIEHAALVEAYGFLRRMLNRLRMTATAGSDDPDLFAGNSPRLAPLARRMGFEDVDVLLTRFLEHRSAVRAAFDRHLS